jgi:signal transduction histidine kinase
MSIISEWVDPYLPVFVKDIVSVIGFLITLGLVKTGVFTAKRGAAAIVYILAVGQNSTLIHAMLFGSDSYQSLLLFATMTDFFVIFIAGFFLSVRSTLIASVILSAILSMAGFLSPQEHLRYLGVMLPLVLTPFILFFYYYRTTIEQLIEKIISARRRLGVKHAELKKTQAYLVTQEKLSALGQLATGMAHEINNPMRFINNYASVSIELLDELQDVLGPRLSLLPPEVANEYLQIKTMLNENIQSIEDQGSRVSGIVSSMLTHARERDVTMIHTDIVRLIQKLVDERDSEAEIFFEADPQLPVSADLVPGDFSRVITNLLDNSEYAIAEKRGTRSDQEYQPSIAIRISQDQEHALIAITDNGSGVSSETKKHIGTPFYTTKPPGKGTGLGLSICRDIIHTIHQGKLELSSEEGFWTSVVITIPKHQHIDGREKA